jgi:hypothetical protein
MIATQEDAAFVVAMATRALEDRALIEGAGLTEGQARAWFALEDK